MNIQDAYRDIVKENELLPDAAQLRVVDTLQQLQHHLQAKRTPWQLMLAKVGLRSKRPAQRGLFLWGGVGRGKTFLMDLFHANLEVTDKRRIHFHRIMREVHERLLRLGDVDDPLDKVAAEIASETRVLCFDEFFVSDIADAMILGRLLEGLFARGVTLVTTSNVPPAGLYRDGLQRERFLPAIALLEQNTFVMEMEAGADYRLRLLQQAGTYLPDADPRSHEKLQQFFTLAAPGGTETDCTLEILGRDIQALRCAKGVAWFDFMEICDGPRSQNDYIEIARWYHTVIVSGVGQMDRDLEDQARRFISMVDEFYDRRVKLILSAAAGVGQLYRGSKLTFEFQRTASRLTEMQSEAYLHEAHIA